MDETWTLGPLDPMTDPTPATGHPETHQVEWGCTTCGWTATTGEWNPALALIEDPDYVLAVIEDDDAG